MLLFCMEKTELKIYFFSIPYFSVLVLFVTFMYFSWKASCTEELENTPEGIKQLQEKI